MDWRENTQARWDPAILSMGTPALVAARQRFAARPLRIYAIISAAREAEASHEAGSIQAQIDALRAQRDAAAAGGGSQFLQLDRRMNSLQDLMPLAVAGASGNSDRVWRSRPAALAVHADLAEMRDFIEAEMGRIIQVLGDAMEQNGWGRPNVADLVKTCPAHHAMSEFLERHLTPAFADLNSLVENPEHSMTTGDRVANISHLLLMAGWRQVKLPEQRSWIQTLTNAILPQSAPATS